MLISYSRGTCLIIKMRMEKINFLIVIKVRFPVAEIVTNDTYYRCHQECSQLADPEDQTRLRKISAVISYLSNVVLKFYLGQICTTFQCFICVELSLH